MNVTLICGRACAHAHVFSRACMDTEVEEASEDNGIQLMCFSSTDEQFFAYSPMHFPSIFTKRVSRVHQRYSTLHRQYMVAKVILGPNSLSPSHLMILFVNTPHLIIKHRNLPDLQRVNGSRLLLLVGLRVDFLGTDGHQALHIAHLQEPKRRFKTSGTS